MKKLVVVSDTHGNLNHLQTLYPIIEENDFVIHLGDGIAETRVLLGQYPEKTYFCAGNCDLFSSLPDEGVLEVERVRIFYCHGHKYGVKTGLKRLAEKAKSLDCELALYGHTHIARIDEIDGVTLVNPGTLSYPQGKGGTYAYIIVHQNKITPVIVGDGLR